MSKILEPSGYILYRVAEDNGFIDRYSIALDDLTRISGPARKIVMLAAECITGQCQAVFLLCQPSPHSQRNWWITGSLRSL